VSRLLLLLDPAFVLLFVTIGRDTHDEGGDFGDVVTTAAPFLIALAAGWTAARVWRDPVGLGTGIIVTAVTLIGGMVLRNLVFGEGTAPAFVVVAALFLSASLLGWRLAAAAVGRL
jgi:hypothetical protein